VHPDDREESSEAFRKCLLDGSDYIGDQRIVRPDVSVRHVRLWGKVIRDEYNHPVRVVGSYLDITEHREAEQALRTSQENLRLLSAHQERIKEHERKRIAREIHDELGGLLTGIKAHLSVAADQASHNGTVSEDLLLEGARMADSAIGTVQRVITDLRPSVLDDLGIWTAIEWYVERTARLAGLECALQIDDSAADTDLDPERSIALFRIVQEALTNVQRHAKASAVRVTATRHDHGILVEIADDGKGIGIKSVGRQHSWGLVGMQERIGHFGGSIDITGQPGHGTVIAVYMPLSAQGAG
jgi:two-component system sensor histidine kinase UhpB